jgi:AmmeMemoRadiSam system protein A
MSSTERTPLLLPEHRRALLVVAGDAIAYGLANGRSLQIVADEYPECLRMPRATFVTLRIAGKLRGCMGTLEASQPLVADVARNAFSAAFRDPRFVALTAVEARRLQTQISVLSVPEPVSFTSEDDLLARVRPHVDGLTLHFRRRRGTLLPAVWTTFPDRREFLGHLKRKAGLPADFWSPEIRVDRYTAESIGHDE